MDNIHQHQSDSVNESQSLESEGGNFKSPPALQLTADPLQLTPVYRGMTDAGGVPALGESARKLGVRKGTDLTVETVGDTETAKHDKKGMSTSPNSPKNLPSHRRPSEWGGTGKDPVWEIDSSDLNTDKIEWHEDDPGKHGIVRPTRDMPYSEFKSELEGTQSKWTKKDAPSSEESDK